MSTQTTLQQIASKIKDMNVGASICLTFPQPLTEVEWDLVIRDLVIMSGCGISGDHDATKVAITKTTDCN